MSFWIVTIGSSDVQLESKQTTSLKKHSESSDKIWNYWYTDALKTQCDDVKLDPKRLFDDKDEPYRVSPRLLGKIYQASSEPVRKTIREYLTFPLLDNFAQALTEHPAPASIFVLLSDQSKIFLDSRQRGNRSPYWQDTCELKPILESYFTSKFPGSTCSWITLAPHAEQQRLDSWDAVFNLVQAKFSEHFPEALLQGLMQPETVYVSHQAGTPALSSAVQFISLSKFDDRVQFLVSNEQSTIAPNIIYSSSYLRETRLQKAKKLLERHDYVGVKEIANSIDFDSDSQTIQVLLTAAIQWNSAKFSAFLEQLYKLPDPEMAQQVQARSQPQNWWWTAYESVYLAWIRLEQGNAVEAFFHSFRAFEGIFSGWSEHEFGEHIKNHKGVPYLQTSVLTDPKQNFADLKSKKGDDFDKLKIKLEQGEAIELSLANICKLFRFLRRDYKNNCKELGIFFNTGHESISGKRNAIVHQVKGIYKEDLLNFWEVSTPKEWQEKMLRFLNFIAEQDIELSWQQASLMAQVDQRLNETL